MADLGQLYRDKHVSFGLDTTGFLDKNKYDLDSICFLFLFLKESKFFIHTRITLSNTSCMSVGKKIFQTAAISFSKANFVKEWA